MAFGGGTFISQNKILPGTYINFVSLARASAALSDRGIAALPLELDWGADVIDVTASQVVKDTAKYFGYAYSHEKMLPIREVFAHATRLIAYRLNAGGVKAANDFATAKYAGTRGNDIKISIVADDGKYEVHTWLDTVEKDVQTVASAAELKSNDWVEFKADATLAATAGTALTGGTNGTVTGESHNAAIAKIDPYAFNVIGVMTTDEAVKKLYAAWIKDRREKYGAKSQLVLYNYAGDYEGIINVATPVSGGNAELVYWVTGLEAGAAVNASAANITYNGEYTIDSDLQPGELEAALMAGQFVLHRVGDEYRTLDDINSLVTTTVEKSADFKANQTIRVLDQIANDTATLFNNKYSSRFPNDADGRKSLWADIVALGNALAKLRAIEVFAPEDVTVEPGETKKAVAVEQKVTPINAMQQLYMTVIVA